MSSVEIPTQNRNNNDEIEGYDSENIFRNNRNNNGSLERGHSRNINSIESESSAEEEDIIDNDFHWQDEDYSLPTGRSKLKHRGKITAEILKLLKPYITAQTRDKNAFKMPENIEMISTILLFCHTVIKY